MTDSKETLSEQPKAGAGRIGKAQWWLAKLDRYGNPTLTDGQHDEQAGANRAFYLHRSFGLTGEERYAVAKVELFEPVADSAGVNHEAVAVVQASLGAQPQPPARHDQGDEVRRLREALERARYAVERGEYATGCCCCGSSVASHGLGDGHSPVDEGDYLKLNVLKDIDAALSASAEGKV